jgi:hypothetical protein
MLTSPKPEKAGIDWNSAGRVVGGIVRTSQLIIGLTAHALGTLDREMFAKASFAEALALHRRRLAAPDMSAPAYDGQGGSGRCS